MNHIYIGSRTTPTADFDDYRIFDALSNGAVAMVGQELSIDTFEAVVMDTEENAKNIYLFRSSDGVTISLVNSQVYAIDVTDGAGVSSLANLPYGTKIWYYSDDKLVGKYYLKNVVRIGKNKYRIECISAIGMLDRMDHEGGMFTRRGENFITVLMNILMEDPHTDSNPVIDFEIDDDVKWLNVSGYLPYDTKRNNLYRLLFSCGVNIIKNENGDPRFTFLYTANSTAEEINDDDVFLAGEIEYLKAYSEINVTEHTYIEDFTAGEVTLYDNTNDETSASSYLVKFSQPIIPQTIQAQNGLTIDAGGGNWGVNYAIVSGKGKLVGVPYTHSTRMVSKKNAAGGDGRVVSVPNCTMVSKINIDNLINRLFAFYCPQNTIQHIKNGIIYRGQKCGLQYSFKNPFNEPVTAFLAKMTSRASSFTKAYCEFYAGYHPVGQAGLYKHVAIITPETDIGTIEYEGDWVVPAGVTSFKVVMIGGGTGGYSGWPGQNGKDASTHANVSADADISGMWYGAEGGNGGNGGDGGSPGRVKVVTIESVAPGTVFHYILGHGGEGGAATGFIPDTEQELRNALANETPNTEYTAEQIAAFLATEQAMTNWNGSPNAGSAGTPTTFGGYSTTNSDSYVPSNGVYDPIKGGTYALVGNSGIHGGKGGARKVEENGTFTWVTDGESVFDKNGNEYRGGRTGSPLTSVSGLLEAPVTAYGGNGAGGAIGIDRATNENTNGNSDQSASWEVIANG